jgi:hypothetical protein
MKLRKSENLKFMRNKQYNRLNVNDLFGENRKNMYVRLNELKDIHDDEKYKMFSITIPL